MAFDNEMSNDVLSFHIGQAFKAGTWVRVSVQGVKSLGGHFACLCREFDFCEVEKNTIIFKKEK